MESSLESLLDNNQPRYVKRVLNTIFSLYFWRKKQSFYSILELFNSLKLWFRSDFSAYFSFFMWSNLFKTIRFESSKSFSSAGYLFYRVQSDLLVSFIVSNQI
uniref:Uncharacterized protein n=1 Tax=Nelumbo nucifera TaxID=4432 RepID=A0A822Z056_NELNU|nr:TPA_asm: hypothetical protein HUJ06_007722 [Nelumbo nucifera]